LILYTKDDGEHSVRATIKSGLDAGLKEPHPDLPDDEAPEQSPRIQPDPAVHATNWPQIRIVPGELPRMVDEAESALLALGREMYQRGGLIVRPVAIEAHGE
jgi:hypothetical protein